ncbi:hypothetical protein SAMN04490357_6560 [Streptomyces misionensis]|uniref:Uncharacterized protein n=1 Tax=Streptomyces misionensis TaxID=67331 RepID=A0A1H5F7I5_9ACTN|nr:hypothetical protein SAMN04490357_6560 [Streptomyces misionensis]
MPAYACDTRRARAASALLLRQHLTTSGQRSLRDIIDRPDAARVRVGVADLSRARPVEREADDDQEGGRGLCLGAAPAADWGTDERRWGKIVWADSEARG